MQKKRMKFNLIFKVSFLIISFTTILIITLFFIKKYKNELIFKNNYAQTLQFSSEIKFLPSPTPTPTPIMPQIQNNPVNKDQELLITTQPQPNNENLINNNFSIPSEYQIKYSNKQYGNYVYYYQCDSQFGSIPLTQGCNFCKAGCGPTTVAMILSTYIDKSFTPLKVKTLYEDLYYSGKYYGYLGCSGSYYVGAKEILGRYFYVTPDIFASKEGYDVKEVINDFKNLINNGYTIFVLAKFEANAHFFWVIDIDENGNVWALDPYYSKNELIPLNENNYYPYPKYKIAFGIKNPKNISNPL